MSRQKKRSQSLDLFISYAGSDRPWAEWAAWHLKAAGYSVELDVWDWAAGDNLTLRINDALDRAVRVLALWSPAYFERNRFTTDEWTALMGQRPDAEGQRRLVPVRVAEVTPPPLLAALLHRDLFGLDEDQAKKTLLQAVEGPRDPKGRPEFPGTAKGKRPRGSEPRLPGMLPPVWNVPWRNALFTGRDVPLLELRDRLTSGSTAVVQALHGMGGVGKSTLAIEYAHRFAGSYELIWWINAEQATLIGEQLTALGTEAGWISADVQTTNPARLVMQRLRRETGWLLIFDNAETRDDLLPWLPQGAGHVLITSRNPGWDQIARPVPLPEFTRDESLHFLRGAVSTLADDRADALANHLGDLPLAVAQAARVLDETGMGAADYMDLLEKQTGDILSEGTPAGYPVPLAAVVRTSAERLEDDNLAAVQLLRLCAFLGPDSIPTDLFGSAPRDVLPQPLADAAASVLTLAQCIKHIRKYGLAKVSEGSIQLHRLTQAILRDSLEPSERQELRERAGATLAAARPDDGKNPVHWPRWAQLAPHIVAFDPTQNASVDVRILACHASSYLLSRGDTRAGREFAERLHKEWSTLLGPDDPQALFAATNVSVADGDLGRYDQARRLDEQIYARRQLILGDDHPDTLISAGNLACSFHALGQHDRALQLHQDTYHRRKRVIGENHPDTLIAATNLADTFHAVGQHDRALQLHQDTYNRLKDVLGEDHPNTLNSAWYVATMWNSTGQHVRALTLHQDTFNRRKRVIGDDHHDTLVSVRSLAETLALLGQHAQARVLARNAFKASRQVLGDEHPGTRVSAKVLAEILRDLGKASEAQRLEAWIRRGGPEDSGEPT